MQKLQIKIAWKLSPFHEDYTFLHNGEFSYADKCSLSNTNLMEGPFEIEENEAIVNQWKTFCKVTFFYRKLLFIIFFSEGVLQNTILFIKKNL